MAKIWVYGDPAQDSTGFKTTLEILTKARSLGGEVEAVVFGPGATDAAKPFGEHGATKVFAGDDPAFAHPPGQHGLPEHVVDLVRAGVRQVLTLQQQAHAEPLGQPGALGDRGGPAGIAVQDGVQLA